MKAGISLQSHLDNWQQGGGDRPTVAKAVLAVAAAAAEIAHLIQKGALAGAMAATTGGSATGDAQKELDVRANDALLHTLRAARVAAVASEELELPEIVDPKGSVVVAIDPLDGSSNIDTNVSIGTIFSILPVQAGGSDVDNILRAFLQPGSAQVAAGYVIYGPSVVMMLTLGQGTLSFTLDPDRKTFVLSGALASIAPETREYAINASNSRHWSPAVRAYVEDCLAGKEGPREADFNMRWIASLVAECHRILVRGGVFLYPRDERKGYQNGRLRLVYEGNPIALIVEQAGGKAIDGTARILDVVPASIHQRTPLIFGSADEVALIARYKADPNAISSRSPLFGRRGLLKD